MFITDQPPVAAKAWLEAFGDIPPNAQQIAPGHSVAAELRSAFDIELQAQPGRIDLFATGPEQPRAVSPDEPNKPEITFIPDLDEVLNVLAPAALVAAKRNSVNRIAVVLTYGQIVKDPAEAVARIGSSVSPLPMPDGATETEYRSNVPAQSRTDAAVTFNQIVRWFTSGRQSLRFGLKTGVSSSVPIFLATQSIDVNTVAGAQFSPDKFSGLFDEMIQRGRSLIGKPYGVS